MLSKFKVALDKEASNMRLRPVCMRETDVEVDALIELSARSQFYALNQKLSRDLR